MGGQGGGGFDAGKCILGQINGKIDDLGREQREIENLEVELKEGINTLKKENAVKVEGHKKKIEEIGKEIYKLFKVNFSLLTDNGRNKVIEFTLGKLGIRTSRSVWTKNIELLKKTLKGFKENPP